MLTVHQIVVGQLEENTYAVVNQQGEALIIDPGNEAERVVEWIRSHNWRPVAVLLTHAHFDHIGAVDAVRQAFQVSLYMHPIEADFLSEPQLNLSAYTEQPVTQAPADVLWESMGIKAMGAFEFEVVFVPGHSPGHVAYIFAADAFVISGDTIFEGGIGRTDLPGGSYVQLIQSIHRELIGLPEAYVLYPGHGGSVTVADSIATNPYFEVFRNQLKHRIREDA